jgi:hypothetical protein
MYSLIGLEKDKKDKGVLNGIGDKIPINYLTDNSYSIKIIKNDIPIIKDSESDESDYEYMYNDELQILSETNKILFNLKGYEFKSYECIDKYLILDIDEGHKFTQNKLYIDLDNFKIYYQIYYYKNRCYTINYDKINKNIIFKDKNYDVIYFFDNINNIIDDYEYLLHNFDTTKDSLLKSLFDMFNKNVDNNSQIKIDGFTYGMMHDIGYFKNILRDNSITIEKQLFKVLFGHIDKIIHKIYDINLTIFYKDNNIDKNFRIILECKDKVPTKIGDNIIYYGYYDENAKLKLIE